VIVNSGAQTIEFADGSAGAPSITNSGNTNTGMFFPAADAIAFAEGGTEAMRIDSSGNVGIGTTSPANTLSIYNATTSSAFIAGDSTTALFTIRSSDDATPSFVSIRKARGNTASPTAVASSDGAGELGFAAYGGTNYRNIARIRGIVDTYTSNTNISGILTFETNAGSTATTERMRIDSAGALILAGSTAQKATGTTWSNPSDQRLKDNIRDYTKGTNELMQVRVREWEYNGKGGTTEGLKGLGVVADEVMTVLPNTVETYDAKLNADDEENTEIKKFDATEITWLLVKTVQEQQTIINDIKTELDNVKTELATLKGAPQ
jgi:hypothetical protein